MPTDSLTGSRYPAASAAPNVAQDIQNAVIDLADNTIPRFASAATRDTAYAAWVAAGGTMQDGLYCHITAGVDRGLWCYNGTTWTWPRWGQGQLSSKARFTPTTAGSAAALVPELTTSITLTSFRRLRLSLAGQVVVSAADTLMGVRIYQGSNQSRVISLTGPLVGRGIPCTTSRFLDLTAGTYNFTVEQTRLEGTGTVRFDADAQNPIEFIVEDMGAL